jgi:hypothetical protein
VPLRSGPHSASNVAVLVTMHRVVLKVTNKLTLTPNERAVSKTQWSDVSVLLAPRVSVPRNVSNVFDWKMESVIVTGERLKIRPGMPICDWHELSTMTMHENAPLEICLLIRRQFAGVFP